MASMLPAWVQAFKRFFFFGLLGDTKGRLRQAPVRAALCPVESAQMNAFVARVRDTTASGQRPNGARPILMT